MLYKNKLTLELELVNSYVTKGYHEKNLGWLNSRIKPESKKVMYPTFFGNIKGDNHDMKSKLIQPLFCEYWPTIVSRNSRRK